VDGWELGLLLGCLEGWLDGCVVGWLDGCMDGLWVGCPIRSVNYNEDYIKLTAMMKVMIKIVIPVKTIVIERIMKISCELRIQRCHCHHENSDSNAWGEICGHNNKKKSWILNIF
jgi:hypothetical protein